MGRRLSRLPLPHFIVFALIIISHCHAAPADQPSPFVLHKGQVLLEVDPNNGAFIRIQDKSSGITLAPPQGMAENFRLTLLNSDKTTATILGKDQKLTKFRFDGNCLALTWEGPLKDTAGTEHKIQVFMVITAVDLPKSNQLEFTLCLSNHQNTNFKVQEAWYPLIGGLTQFGLPGKESDASVWVPTSSPWEKQVKLPFDAAAFQYPGQMNMSFTCIQSKSAKKSLYFASHDKIARYKAYHFMELSGSNGKDLFACIHHSPFTPPGESFQGSEVVLKFVDGDWRAAGKVYRHWFNGAFGIAYPSDSWIRRQSFFLMTMFMLPEGTINYTFKDIPKWAKAAKEHGINSVQISGWQMGGHDNGYPYYIPDPRLGTWKELEDGIRECHKMGMKVYFFVNYQPMMVESDWYKKELHKYREMAHDGGHTWMAGWGMGTLWARMGHPKLMTWADLSFPQFRKIIVDQFSKLAQIGGDGVHVDKMFPAALCYNPDIQMSPDTSTWEGSIILTKEIMEECRKHNPNWAMSFECNWDRVLQFGGATWWVGNQLITRQVFPEHAETLGLYQAYDYLGVNNAVRNGHIVMVAPLNFSRGFEWKPFEGLADYIKEVKRIRDSLQETVFYGEILWQSEITLKNHLESGIEYNVFRNLNNILRTCIFTNSSIKPHKVTVSGFDTKLGNKVRIHTPFKKPYTVQLPAVVEIPAERIVFVEEIGGAE